MAFDQDPDAIKNVPDDDRLVFIGHNFQYLKNFLKYYEMLPVNGILADLGVSSYQIDNAERGFSFRFEALLDMRMNQNQQIDAKTILNEYEEESLKQLFSRYGEFKRSGTLARRVVEYRQLKNISSTEDLLEIARPLLDRKQENRGLAQIFQALRIEVNGEMRVLEDFLESATKVLAPGGRLVVMSYHSLEDRLVKNFISSGNAEGEVKQDFYGNVIKPLQAINKKPITASEEELKINPRARSAKLRIAEKL
jgi:16S rRNA (cytosine1402-N4)-methyltransferase